MDSAPNCNELNYCPDEFAERVTEAGGLNRYDEPNFKVVWQRSEFYRAGGVWAGYDQVTVKGYRWLPYSFEKGWALVQWQPPEKYGKPVSYYVAGLDETGYQLLGEYPYSGRYEIVMPFIWKGIVNGRLVVEHMPLTSLLVDLIVPIIHEAKALSWERKRALMLEEKERQDRAQLSQIESRLADAYPAFGTASRSASRLACNSVVQRRAEAIERHWKNALRELTVRGKGISVGRLR